MDESNRYAELDTMASSESLNGNKIIVSNHSYADDAGWGSSFGTDYGCAQNSNGWWGVKEVSTTEDYKFGRYSNLNYTSDSLYDETAFNHPYLTIVKAAGNDKGQSKGLPFDRLTTPDSGLTWSIECALTSGKPEKDGGPDGYDCIPAGSVAKNILLTGACNNLLVPYTGPADIVLKGSSGRGPVDDGRIKPDVVAPGGPTSYATAVVSGTVLLLQQAYHNLNSRFMLSSTVRALICHTAFEAGPFEGPDYDHGWGMVNAEEAGLMIRDNGSGRILIEDTLDDRDTVYYFFRSDSVNNPIRVTLGWTDPEGEPADLLYLPSDLNNRAPMLVNDLDLKLVSYCFGQEYYPYTLDPDAPSDPPVKQVNEVDNIEQIREILPGPGWYGVMITHKDSLTNGGQAFSLIMSGLEIANYWNGGNWSLGPPDSIPRDLVLLEDYRHDLPAGFAVKSLVIAPGKILEISEPAAEVKCTGDILCEKGTVRGKGKLITGGKSNICGHLRVDLE